jgi:peptide/nickel transport system substrate-binding protein
MLLLSACGSGSSSNTTSTTPKKGGDITVGLFADPITLDPLTSTSLYASDVMTNLYDSLFRYNTQTVLEPDLATSYKFITSTELQLILRTDVKFQDGTPFNAQAVVFNIERFLNDPASPRYTNVTDISAVKATSDSQVVINLKKPFGAILDVLAGPVGTILSPTAIKKLGSQLGNDPVGAGSGPFVFSKWIKSNYLKITANPNYWQKDAQGNKLPYLQSVTFKPITDGTVMYNNLQTNQIQIATSVNPNLVTQMKSNPALTYNQVIGPGFGTIQFNTAAAPLNNVHVRRAVAWGINRQEILQNVNKGVGMVANGPISPASWAFSKTYSSYSYNVNTAKSELAQAGVSKVSFNLIISSGSPTILQEAQFIQAELQPVGITVNIKQETFDALIADYDALHYQALLVGWTGDPDPDGTMYAMFTSTGSLNYNKYSDPQVDTLLNEGRTTLDQAQRAQYYQQAEALIVQDVPAVFVTWSAVQQLTTSKVKNYPLLTSGVTRLTSVYLSS